jgi:hypothetical protein
MFCLQNLKMRSLVCCLMLILLVREHAAILPIVGTFNIQRILESLERKAKGRLYFMFPNVLKNSHLKLLDRYSAGSIFLPLLQIMTTKFCLEF